jgi:cysteine desulfurase
LFKGADSDALIMGLCNPESDSPLIAVSNGSACTSANIEPSHVLIAMGLNETSAFSSIRFSLGKYNSQQEIIVVINSVKKSVEDLREMVK